MALANSNQYATANPNQNQHHQSSFMALSNSANASNYTNNCSPAPSPLDPSMRSGPSGGSLSGLPPHMSAAASASAGLGNSNNQGAGMGGNGGAGSMNSSSGSAFAPPSQNNSTTSMNLVQGSQEDISTIFVVGFPEDISEREFYNMFIFAPGFEAATLKFPTNFDQDDSIPLYKKQVIGFAKFYTKFDALHALEVINGRRVDMERGNILKAEIAKKNLHTRRSGVSFSEITPSPSPAYMSAFTSLVPMAPMIVPNVSANHVGNMGPFSNNSSLTPTLPVGVAQTVPIRKIVPTSLSKDMVGASGNDSYYLGSPIPKELMAGPTTAQALAAAASASLEYYSSPPPEQESSMSRRGSPASDASNMSDRNSNSNNNGNHMSNSAISYQSASSDMLDSGISRPSSTSLLNNSNNGMESPRTVNEGMSASLPALKAISSRQNSTSDRGFSSALFSSETILPRMAPSPLTINTSVMPGVNPTPSPTPNTVASPLTVGPPSNMIAHPNVPVGSLSGTMSPTTTAFTNPGYRCMADYNPPCNTLYVGNLPPNTSEVELRDLFSRCAGFKRLCFRHRPNGPMCFVEFDDVPYASQALNSLHGAMLSTSIKGGIRLSFSKNPLGIRQGSGTVSPVTVGNPNKI
ncbi:hypothetical protein HDV05_004839 [Chytridiales sp. JEL 0842]|nr:hypothetical protein HDV05_004839 [Chytridiales sp. JEL 0842]